MRERAVLGLLSAGVVVAVVVAHWPVLSAGALSFDDSDYLTDNALVRNPSWNSTWRFFSEVLEPSTVRGYYQPLTMISLMGDVALRGRPDNLRPLHRTSLLLHVANTVLVLVLLYRLFGRPIVAALVAALFVLHPMTVEPVAWLAERKTLLAAFFMLWSLVAYVSYTRRQTCVAYGVSLGAFVLALLSKPTSVPLPALLLLLDFWPLRRLSARVVVEKVPFILLGVVSAVITFVSQARTATVIMPQEYVAWQIPLMICHNIFLYLSKMLWPTSLSFCYSFPSPLSLSQPQVAAGVIGTVALAVALLVSLRWTRSIVTGALFFFVAIFPTMGVIGFTMVAAADKYAYLPVVGLLITLAYLLGCWWDGQARDRGATVRKTTTLVVFAAVLAGEAAAIRAYLPAWKSSEILYRHMIAGSPESPAPCNGLADTLAEQGRSDEAVAWYHQALTLLPEYPRAHCNLASELIARGDLAGAVEHATRALRRQPRFAKAWYNLGTALLLRDRTAEAIEAFQEALEQKWCSADAYNNLGVALFKQGQIADALKRFHQALTADTNHVKARANLDAALREPGSPARETRPAPEP